jgi:two-component system, NtrC family, response regulator GlrR
MSDTSKGVLLIVDDEPLKCATLRIDLSNAGYTVLDAADAENGLQCLRDQHVDAVISDLRMPGMDGLQFLQQIKSQWPAVPVILMTAFGTVDSAVEAMRQGVHDYITKPFSSDVLIDKLDRLLSANPAEGNGHEQPELEQLIGRALRLAGSDAIRSDQFIAPAPSQTSSLMAGLTETIAGVERTLIDAALRRAAGNQAKAAQFLRIPRTTLRDKMAKYGMVGDPKRQPAI